MAVLTPVVFPSEPGVFNIEAQAGFVAAAVGGDSFPNAGKTGLYVKNASGSSKTLTIVAPRKCDHGFTHSAVIVIPDGHADFVAKELENDRFSDDAGMVSLTYSAVGLSVAAVRLS